MLLTLARPKTNFQISESHFNIHLRLVIAFFSSFQPIQTTGMLFKLIKNLIGHFSQFLH